MGILFAIFLFIFHIHLLAVVFDLLREGDETRAL